MLLSLAVDAAAAVSGSPLVSVENLIALLTLTAMEVVLGIDNIVFIAVLSGRLPEHQRASARRIGLLLALVMRIALLGVLTWMMRLAVHPLFTLPLLEHAVTGRDLILIAGGMFLIGKATHEIHGMMENHADLGNAGRVGATFRATVVQILLIDLVFSVDSIVTAVGMAQALWVMVTAVVISVGLMLAFSGVIASFIERHPTFKMLALSFLVLIGVVLVADGIGQHIAKGYVYFGMAFSLGVEMLNMAVRRRVVRRSLSTAGEP
ncbi:MAG: TerC family protein [Phycisphaeraceae bacterium]|nr:TerC family protein [Phycisphaeraceae bacterium]